MSNINLNGQLSHSWVIKWIHKCIFFYLIANRKHYEWQLSNGHQWQPIDNDHVIETHYCQPGAKGITINFENSRSVLWFFNFFNLLPDIKRHNCLLMSSSMCLHRQVFIDFDKLETTTAGLRVQRLSFLPRRRREAVGWYFRDDQLWREYGSQVRKIYIHLILRGFHKLNSLPLPQSPSMSSSSVSSKDVERQFTLNPRGTFSFTVGSTGYSLDFSSVWYFCYFARFQ